MNRKADEKQARNALVDAKPRRGSLFHNCNKFMLAAVMPLGFCMSLFAETETIGDYTWTYQINGDAAEIHGIEGEDFFSYSAAISPMPTGAVTIPSTLGGKPVTSIGSGAFYNCSGLTGVTIPDSVTSIGWEAFSGCSGLTSVTIPNSVTSIGDSAFDGCSGLTSVTIPNSVTSIGSYAFSGCNDALFDMTTILGVELVDGWVVGCADSVSGTLNLAGVRGIGNSAFAYCSGLASVTIPDGVTSIGNGVFSGCSGLTSVTIPDSVTSIEDVAFSFCSGLTSVTIPNSVTSIGEYAFSGCSGLTSVTIPNSVTSIGDGAFFGCSGLISFSVGSDNAYYKSLTGLLLSKDGETLVAGVNGDVRIPDSVTSIWDGAFYNCSGLTSVTIPNSVTSIGYSAFEGCSGLTSVTIPNSVTSIGEYAFFGCSGLISFSVGSDNAYYKSVTGLLLSKDGETLVAGVNGDVTIPDSVTSIWDGAFSYRSGLTSVTIPNSVTSIGYSAFSGCSGLTSVTIPNSVTSIGEYAFSDCSGLTSVTIPNSVTSIGDGAFSFCSGLSTVYVGLGDTERVKSLLEASYCDVSRLTFVEKGVASYKLTLKPSSTKHGTVSGGGTYKFGAKATIKAKAKSGYVFAGWFTDKSCKKPLNPNGYDNRKPTVKYTMPAKNTTVYAKFVTKAAAKKSLKFSSATKKLAKTAKKATAGKAFSLALGFSSASLPTVTAKGLPKGLKIDKTTGKITGVGTVPGSYTATITVKDAAGNKITQKVKITVETAAFANGTFYGTAKPGKSSDPSAYLQFTVGKTGKVSGKVTYNGKAYSFSSSLASCTVSKATFSPKVKIGSKTFKPGTVTVKTRKVGGLSLVEAANSKGTFAAQKKPNLVKKGRPLAALIGWTETFDRTAQNSGLTKKKDRLTVVLANGDAVKVTGVVNGKKLTALSWVTLVSGMTTSGGITTYTLYADIISASPKYERTLVITATVGPSGVNATAAFAK